MRKLFFIIVAILGFFLLSQPQLSTVIAQGNPFEPDPLAGCGSYNTQDPTRPPRCISTGGSTITPFQRCSTNPNACCPSANTPAQCTDSSTLPPVDPADESSQNCGTYTTGNVRCIDNDGKIISNGTSCTAILTQCCREVSQCVQSRYGWDAAQGICVVSATGLFIALDDCFRSGPPPPPIIISDDQKICCPVGFSQNFNACPLISDSDTCCRRPPGSVALTFEYAPAFACQNKYSLCDQIPASVISSSGESSQDLCSNCERTGGVWTAIGCIKSDATSIVQKIILIGLSIGGGVALLMILAAAFLFSTSQGDPKRVSDARELITSAIIGLLFIIFSITLLQFIGVNILRLPGFGGATSITPGVTGGLSP